MPVREISLKTHEFNDKEVAMLVTLYEHPGAKFTTYGLFQKLHPALDPAKQESAKPFEDVRATSERLIMLDLVDGNRLKAQ